MPARAAPSNRCIPCGFGLIGSRLPKSEVARVFFFVLVGVDALAATRDVSRKIDLRKLPIVRKRCDSEIDRIIRSISVPPLLELLDQVRHLRNVTRGARRDIRTLTAQRVKEIGR